MLLHANCISRCRVTENMGYMQELECRVKGKIPPEIKGLWKDSVNIRNIYLPMLLRLIFTLYIYLKVYK